MAKLEFNVSYSVIICYTDFNRLNNGGFMDERIFKLIIKQIEQCRTSEILEAIKEQERLSNIMHNKKIEFDKYRDQSFLLLREGTKKLIEEHPELKEDLPEEDTKLDIVHRALDVAINNPNKFSEILTKMKEIPELNENNKIQPLITRSFYEYMVAFSNFESRLKEDREWLFTSEYKDKMASYAEEGMFLYHLETPDLPILDKDIQMKDIIDYFLFEDCTGLRIACLALLDMDNPGVSMIRKQEDIRATIALINCGHYRSAVRTLFALLDSEHKKAANVYEGIVAKKKLFKNGLQRSQKIDKLINSLDDPWIDVAWDKINCYYKKVVSTNPVEGVIHRNSIVHGDYDSNLIDVDKYSATKMLLLYLNLRIIADYLCNKEEIFEEVLLYLPSIILMLKEKQSDN